jgi:hypothetical protein
LIGSSLGQYVVVLLVVVITFGVCFVLGVTAIAGYFYLAPALSRLQP